jgi:hypothetical protein
MTLRVEHELHRRRLGRNTGVALVLVGLAAVVFMLTIVKVQQGGSLEGFDHTYRPGLAERWEASREP